MPSGAKLKGVEDMRRKLIAVQAAFPKVVARALYRRAEAVMTRSKNEFVPVAEIRGGTLRASGRVAPPVIKGKRISVGMGYGGPADDYAVAVHEHLSEHSPPSWVAAEADGDGVHFHLEGRGPKYLEIPLMAAVATMTEDIAADIDLRKLVIK